MEKVDRKSIYDDLSKYTYSSNKDDFIEVTEWSNGDGYDIILDDKSGNRFISISDLELDAINYLIMRLRYE